MKQEIDALLKVREAADALAISRSKIYAMMDCGELPFVKLGRSRRIRAADLRKLVEQHTVAAK